MATTVLFFETEDLGHPVEISDPEFAINLPEIPGHTWEIEGPQPSETKHYLTNCTTPAWRVRDLPELLEGQTIKIIARLKPNADTTMAEEIECVLPLFVRWKPPI